MPGKNLHEHIHPAIKANGSYEGYQMGTSLARPLIAEEVVKIAKKGRRNRSWPRMYRKRERSTAV